MANARVSKRNNGRFYIDLRPLGGTRRSLGTTSPKVAQARIAEAQALLGGPTLAEAHRRMMQVRWSAHKAPPVKVYNQVARILGAGTRLGSIDRDRLDALVATSRGEGAAPATINRRLAYLSVILRDALDREEIDRVPRLPKQREPQGRQQVIDRKTEAAIISCFLRLSQPDLARLVIVAVDTGLRLSELLRLEPRDIQARRLTVRESKSGRSRTIPLTERAVVACDSGLWQDWTVHRVEHYWKLMREALKRPELLFHGLRHTCATRLLQAGMDTRRVQVWMGHSNIQTTVRYTHVDTKDLEVLRNALEGR